MPDQLKPLHHAFFNNFEIRKNVIQTVCHVSSPFDSSTQNTQVNAIWDTGATLTAINPSLALQLGLLTVGRKPVRGVHSEQEVNEYIINLTLPNKLEIKNIPVVAIDIGSDVLIGMDIIGAGDFVICRGQYFSFVYPSFDNPMNFVDKGNSVNKKVQSHNKKVQMTNSRGGKGFRPKKKARKK